MPSDVARPIKQNPLFISEILALVFSFLHEKTLAKFVCICKQWAEIGIDCLWREVTDVRRLLNLLGPLTLERVGRTNSNIHHVYKFRRGLQPSGWKRFQRYARRVRKLYHDDKTLLSKRRAVDPSIYAEIARTRASHDLLPNLQSLIWYATDAARQQCSLTFLHANVRHLSIQLHGSPDVPLAMYLDDVRKAVPYLTDLELRSETAMRDLQDDVGPFLRGISRLQRLIAPMFCLTSEIIRELSRLEMLSTIAFGAPVEREIGDRADVGHFSPTLQQGAFPSLTKLSFSAQIPHATHFMRQPFAPRNITYLNVHILVTDAPDVLHEFFAVVVDNCRSLTALYVDFGITPDAPIQSPPPPLITRPTIDAFRPLFACRHLTRFEFRWDYELNFTQTDMEQLAANVPLIEILFFNSEPVPENGGPILTLQALVPFAYHCHRLRELSLYVNAMSIPSDVDSHPLEPFRSLQTLAIGISSIAAVEPVALFLSRLCPLDCQIVSGVRWPDAYGIALDKARILDDRRVRLTQWWVKWTEVAKVLPLAIKARMEEKSKMVRLQEEMEVLTVSRRRERDQMDRLEREVRDLRNRGGGPS